MDFKMNNKVENSSPSELYARPNPIPHSNRYIFKEKTVKIQKIDDYIYYTKQLFHAVQHGYLQFLESVPQRVLQNRLNVLDEKNNYSLLHYACLENHQYIVSYLLMLKPDVNIVGAKQMRPIHLATQKGHVEIVELLCKQRSIQIDATDSKGQTPLHTACRRGHLEVVKVLLKNKASVNKVELDGISVLHHPVRRNDIPMVQTLVTFDAPLNLRNNNGQTPIMIAAIEGHSNMFQLLLDQMRNYGMNVAEIINEKDNDGFSSLSHAVHNKNSEIIKFCIENDADIYSKQNDGKTIFHGAAIMGYSDLFNIFGDKNYDLNATDNGLNTPLHLAIMNNKMEMVQLLLTKGANVNVCNRHFQTPIMVACTEIAQTKYCSEIIKILHEAKADLKIRDFEMKTVFHYLVEKENIEMIEYFANSIKPEILKELVNSQDDSYNSPLHCAAKIGNSEICKLLLRMGTNPILFAENDALAVHVATINGHLECVKVLLEAFQQTNFYRDGDENSAINLAAENGRYEIFKYLVSINKDHLSKDEFGRNTLMSAAKSGCLPIIELLLDEEVNVNLYDQTKTTALHIAAERGHLEVVKRLWKHGAKLSENIYGQSQLDVAVNNNQWSVVRFFLNNENWKQVMRYRHKSGQSHIKVLIKKNEDITLELLDKCITEKTINKLDPNYEIKYWFGLLDAGPDDSASISRRYLALKTMAENGRLNLLRHPVSIKLLLTKWKKIGIGFYLLDFFTYLIFLICITYYMSINIPLQDGDNYTASTGCKKIQNADTQKSAPSKEVLFLNSVVYCIATGQLLLQLGKLITQRLRFFREIWNYVFIVCHILVFVFIKDPNTLPCLYEWQFGPALIFVAWLLLLYYLQYWPTVGIYVMMFKKVLFSVIKVYLIFFCLFVGFGFGFYIINSAQDPFKTQWLGIIKSIGMMIGELDLVTYFLTGKALYSNISYSMIVIFIVFMPITLFNLMIGLAVGDTEKMASEASLESFKLMVNFVWEMEAMLPIRSQRYFYISEIVENSNNTEKIEILYRVFYKIGFFQEIEDSDKLKNNTEE